MTTGPSGGSEGGELHPAQGTALAPPVYTGLHLLPGHRPLATLNPPRHAFTGMPGTRLQATLPHSLRLQKHSCTRRCHQVPSYGSKEHFSSSLQVVKLLCKMLEKNYRTDWKKNATFPVGAALHSSLEGVCKHLWPTPVAVR